jgi:hypothetical protein
MMDGTPMKDWSYTELVQQATWLVIQSVIKGEIEQGVSKAVSLALRWRAEQPR